MAVYTSVTGAQVAGFLEAYDLGAYESHEGIAQGVTNSNFHLFTDKGRYILTLFEPRRTDYAQLPFCFAFANHLEAKGIRCPKALPDRKGNIIGELASRPAVILEFLEGRDVPKADLAPAHCAQAGALTAHMHCAARDFAQTRDNTMGVARWPALVEKARDYGDGSYDELAAEMDWLHENWPRDLESGAVHADIFPDNVFFTDGKLSAVIDFYFSCTEFYAFDLAVTINAWCFEGEKTFSPARFDAMMDSYRAVRPVPPEERAALQVLARGTAFRTLISRLEEYHAHDPENTLMTPHDPAEYLARLRFHQENDIAAFL